METRKGEINKIGKHKVHDFEYVENMENINNHHPRAHFIIINNSSIAFTQWKKEKLEALLVYSSIVRVATSGFRRIAYSLVVVCSQMKSDPGIIPYSLLHGIVRKVVVTSAN